MTSALLIAVLTSSLIGSVHCIGMCGPFAMYAAVSDQKFGWLRLSLYHIGRLVSYLMVGAVVGIAGHILNLGGTWNGLSSVAAMVCGVLLVGIGIGYLMGQRQWFAHSQWGNAVTKQLTKAKAFIARMPKPVRPMLIGTVTSLLPCGWMYTFAIAAAGTGGPLPAMAIMSAFWIGTLPWLSGVSTVLSPLQAQARWGHLLTGLMMIAAGCYTASGRAMADMSPLLQLTQPATPQTTEPNPELLIQQLNESTNKPLPCCHGTELTNPQ